MNRKNRQVNQTTSISQRLHENLSDIISRTDSGARLPSEPVLARQLGVSRATLREAMRTFETQGLIRRRQGSGTFVIHPAQVIETGLEVLESIETLAQRMGLPVTMGEMGCEQRPVNEEEAQTLKLEEGKPVIQISRVIQAQGRPVAYLIDVLPGDLISPQELSSGFTGSVLDLLIRRSSPAPDVSRTEVNAVTAPSQVAKAMGLQRGDVLLLFTALLYAPDGRVIDYSYSYFLPGCFRFYINRRVGA